jgi:hypothetical protein
MSGVRSSIEPGSIAYRRTGKGLAIQRGNPMPEKHVQDLVDVIEKVRGDLKEPEVFYSEDGKKALVMTHNHRDDVDDLRAYVTTGQFW